MSAVTMVTVIYLFRLLLNIVSFVVLKNSAYPDEMPHDVISQVYKCKKYVLKNKVHNWNEAEYLF